MPAAASATVVSRSWPGEVIASSLNKQPSGHLALSEKKTNAPITASKRMVNSVIIHNNSRFLLRNLKSAMHRFMATGCNELWQKRNITWTSTQTILKFLVVSEISPPQHQTQGYFTANEGEDMGERI